MEELIFSVKRSLHRRDDPIRDHADKIFRAKVPLILERDDYICQYCEFASRKFQEVHHVDDNHQNNDESNLKTICCLCHAVQHVWFSGLKARGELIYIEPVAGISFTQADLNQLVRFLWIAEEGADKAIAASTSARLTGLAHATKDAFDRVETNDLCTLGDRLLQMSDAEYANRAKYWAGFYVLPKKAAFQKQLAYWSQASSSTTPTTAWFGMARKKIAGWLENKGVPNSPEGIKSLLGISTT